MKQRTTALLLAAALVLSLLATAALAAEGDPDAPASSAVQTEPAEGSGTSAGEPETQGETAQNEDGSETAGADTGEDGGETDTPVEEYIQIGRASCRERV